MYKLENNDVVKILPIIMKDGTFVPTIQIDRYYVDGKFICDTNNYLKHALYKKFSDVNGGNPQTRLLSRKYILCIFHEGEVKFTLIGKTIMEKIKEDYKFDPRNDYQLQISVEMVTTGVGPMQSFDKSAIILKDWNKPDIDLNVQSDWKNWLNKNIPYYIEDYIERNGIFNNMDTIKKAGLSEYLQDAIMENREKKINQVLT